MRVVLDTNVLVSAALKPDPTPAAALNRVAESGVLLKSLATERQLFEVLARPRFALLIGDATEALRRLMDAAELVAITERIAACRDPTDDRFLELAVCGRADGIVSGDRDLLALDPFRGIPIVTPAAFVRAPA
jgi:putative PIN family toxin of toxin-antitoxin system